ncbi:hypothetical protein FQA39_LY08882 [Lamprigera yunnana]|nr:hypothetical protein FQA39_LY08882 [Lamprigera yunnana]
MADGGIVHWIPPPVRDENYGRGMLRRHFFPVLHQIQGSRVCNVVLPLNGLTRQQFAEIIWNINEHVNGNRLRCTEDLWVSYEHPKLGFARWHGPDVLSESWDLAVRSPTSEDFLMREYGNGYVPPASFIDCEEEEEDKDYEKRCFSDWLRHR